MDMMKKINPDKKIHNMNIYVPLLNKMIRYSKILEFENSSFAKIGDEIKFQR